MIFLSLHEAYLAWYVWKIVLKFYLPQYKLHVLTFPLQIYWYRQQIESAHLNYIQSGFYIWFPLIWAYTVLQDARSLLMQISSPLDFRIYFLQKCA